MTSRKLADLIASARIQPAVNQVESHPFLAQRKLKAFCDEHKIVLTAFSPLGSPDRPVRLVEEADPKPLFDETITGIAARLGVTPAQVLIRWAVQRGTVVIPKSITPDRIASNIDVFKFELTDDDMAAIAKLDAGRRLIKGYPFGEWWSPVVGAIRATICILWLPITLVLVACAATTALVACSEHRPCRCIRG